MLLRIKSLCTFYNKISYIVFFLKYKNFLIAMHFHGKRQQFNNFDMPLSSCYFYTYIIIPRLTLTSISRYTLSLSLFRDCGRENFHDFFSSTNPGCGNFFHLNKNNFSHQKTFAKF